LTARIVNGVGTLGVPFSSGGVMDLDVNNPDHVISHSVVRADLGQGGRSIVVISGIARPEWHIDTDELTNASCRVLLHEPAEVVEQSSATVSLASVGNEDTEWLFAVDDATVNVAGSELVLDTQLALIGEPSFLHRFSFQVVLLTRDVPTAISGELTWNTTFFRPAEATPSAVQNAFVIDANTVTFDAGAPAGPGAFAPGTPHFTPVATGAIVSVSVADDVCHATYLIANPPKLQQLVVTVGAPGLHALGGGPIVMKPAGAFQFTLTAANPTQEHVDFSAHQDVGPA
jgi:hypothetical protein